MKRKGKKKSRYKKVKFKEVKFKLSEKQYRSLVKYCKLRHTTTIKLIKKSINKYINSFDEPPAKEYFISPRQLDLFADESSFSSEKTENNKP